MNNPTASVVRSKEVEEALKVLQGWADSKKYDDHPKGPMLITEVARILLPHIAELEASQPKPQSDDGLRGKPGHLDLPAWIQNELSFCRSQGKQSEAATYILEKMLRDFPGLTFHLSQAPVPTTSDEDCARHILRTTATEGDHEEEVARLSAILAKHRQGFAPVPTSGAVEVAETIDRDCVGFFKGTKAQYFDKEKAAAIIRQALDAAELKGANQLKAAQETVAEIIAEEATQPPAADGKLREALERIVQWANAYPLKIFAEPDFKKAHELLQAGGMTIDAISASNMRHVVKGVGEIAREALAQQTRGGEGDV